MNKSELKPRSEWKAQWKAALEAWGAMDPKPATLVDLIELAPRTAFLLIQAMDALGEPVSIDLKEWVKGEGRFL